MIDNEKIKDEHAKEFIKHPVRWALGTVIVCLIILLLTLMIPNPPGKNESAKHLREGSNLLIRSTSPYLLRHAKNPVDWYPWGEEAFIEARKTNKPILISIGYSTCYWCHVMERQVFKDKKIAKLMNDSFVNVKVDREERPDIDAIYMAATQVIKGRNGWPNNVFATPDLKPFFAETYVSPEKFKFLIKSISEDWNKKQEKTKKQADKISDLLVGFKFQGNLNAQDITSKPLVKSLFTEFSNHYDEKFGGFYQAPKFPNENILLFLLSYYKSQDNERALIIAEDTLDKMAKGGIHDHVGGGFHRYSVDDRWHVPDFKKMLYNQALLSLSYLNLYKISGSPIHKDVAQKTYDYVLELMTHKQGGFYSAFAAETNEIEGEYYAWTREELELSLGKDQLEWFDKYYDLVDIPEIQGHKNTDGKILYLRKDFPKKEMWRNWEIMKILSLKRFKRQLPDLYDKVITAWNGLMINSFANAGLALNKQKYISAAQRAADFILSNLRQNNGNLYRIWRNGEVNTSAFFEDYAFMVQGLVSLYKATLNDKYLEEAESLIIKSRDLFWDNKNGGYYFSDGSEKLLVRIKNAQDSRIPSGNAVMLHAFLDLYVITSEEKWKNQAKEILESFTIAMEKNPIGYTHMIHGLMRYNNIYAEITTNVNIKDTAKEDSGLGKEDNNHVKVFVPKKFISKEGNGIFKLMVKVNIGKDWHVNANPPTMDFLIPTSIDVRSSQGKVEIKNIEYPASKKVDTPLGVIDVYDGDLSIPVTIFLESNNVKNIRVLTRTQACKGAVCLLPSDQVTLVTLDRS